MKKTTTSRARTAKEAKPEKVKLTLDALRPVSDDVLSQCVAGLMIIA